MRIPLHSLVLDFTSSFSEISYNSVSCGIFGSEGGYYCSSDIMNELKRRVNTKLWLGERVIVSGKNLKFYDRKLLTEQAKLWGLNIYYILDDNEQNIDLVRGDNIAEVVKESLVSFTEKCNQTNFNLHNYRGFTVIGDVHGQLESLLNVVEWSNNRQTLPVFLGDIIDFGVKSLECVEEVYKLVIRGKALFIIGNHERKIYKWLNKNSNKNIKMFLSEANKKTINQIQNMDTFSRNRWEIKFRALMNLGFTHINIDNQLFFVHAAFTAEMLNYQCRILPSWLEKTALFGSIDSSADWNDKDSSPVSYSWIDEIPNNLTVFVGHEVKNPFKPLEIVNTGGGRVVFMDTNSGKGGNLSSADILFRNNTFNIQNFNHW